MLHENALNTEEIKSNLTLNSIVHIIISGFQNPSCIFSTHNSLHFEMQHNHFLNKLILALGPIRGVKGVCKGLHVIF